MKEKMIEFIKSKAPFDVEPAISFTGRREALWLDIENVTSEGVRYVQYGMPRADEDRVLGEYVKSFNEMSIDDLSRVYSYISLK